MINDLEERSQKISLLFLLLTIRKRLCEDLKTLPVIRNCIMKKDKDKARAGDDIVPTEDYIKGISNILGLFITDLPTFMEAEGRNYGRVKTYMKRLELAWDRLSAGIDREIGAKVLYLFKPVLLKEHRRLVSRAKLSPGDSALTLGRMVIDFLERNGEGFKDHAPGFREIRSVFVSMWDNIRNNRKNDDCRLLNQTLDKWFEEKRVGRYELGNFTLVHRPNVKTVLTDPGVVFEECGESDLANEVYEW